MSAARENILVTGGAGFVGSHFVRVAHEVGSHLVLLDDLSSGPHPQLPSDVVFVRGDIGDRALVSKLIREHRITAITHFAGKTEVGESVRNPERYFDHNLIRTHALLDVVRSDGPGVFVFSSSAAVYGNPVNVPIVETAAIAPINPYGMSKLGVEHALASYAVSSGLRWAALRYFNAAGAHPDGTLREAHEPETHLIPLAIDAALGRRSPLAIFGDDYLTPDGTCIRDYVHVCDVADAHLAAIDALDRGETVAAVNLGSGVGFSVREVIDAIPRVLGRAVPHSIVSRRPGDPATLVASNAHARAVLGWHPRRDHLAVILEDAARSRL